MQKHYKLCIINLSEKLKPPINRDGLIIHRAWGAMDDPGLRPTQPEMIVEEQIVEEKPVITEPTTQSWGRQAEALGLTSSRNWLPQEDPSLQG